VRLRSRQRILLLLCLTLALLAGMAAAQRPCQVSAFVTPEPARVGDSIVYVVRVQCTDAQEEPVVQPPDLLPDSGLTELKQAGVTRQMIIINGSATRTFEFRFAFTAQRAGEYTIPPATVGVDGETYQTNEVKLHVGTAPSAPADRVPAELRPYVVTPRVPGAPQLESQLAGKIFVLALPETTEPLSGQQFLLSYHLFLDQEGLAAVGINPQRFSGNGNVHVPELKEFLKEELYGLPQNLRFQDQMIGERHYAVAPLYQVAITPTRSGKITIEPFQLGIVLPLRQQRRSGSPFDDPLFDMFDFDPFNAQGLEVIAQSTPVELSVQPLPADQKPPDFSGAVGRFKLEASLDKTRAVANEDVVRLRVTLSGEGNAAVAVAPQFPNVDGLQLLEEPKTSTDRKIENNKLITSKTFDYLFRPTKAGKLSLPPITMSVFNPATRRYERLSTPETQLVVAPGTATPVLAAPVATPTALAATPAEKAAPEVRTDLRYIHDAPLSAWTAEGLRREQEIQVALVALSTLLFCTAWVASERRRRRQHRGLEYLRAKARETLEDALRRAENQRAASPVDEARALGEALRGYFAALLDLDPAALTTEELYRLLEEAGVSEESARTLREVLEACDSIRYTPVAESGRQLNTMASSARQVVKEAEQCFDR
jgi:hypothetical protein